MKYTCTGSYHFRIEESELLYMRLGQFAVSFEGYKYSHDNKRTLGPARGKHEWYGPNLGVTEQCDFNSNDWYSPRYDFKKNGYYFDASMKDYPFEPHAKGYWKEADKYMLWESDAWEKRSDNYWSAKGIMEESVWKQLTNPFNTTGSAKIIRDCGFTQDDLALETIYLHEEFDTKEELNEAHKDLRIKEYEAKINRLKQLPYGRTR